MEDMETMFAHEFPQFEVSSKAKSFDLGEDAEAGRDEFVEMERREYSKRVLGREKISFFPEKIEILHGVNGRPSKK